MLACHFDNAGTRRKTFLDDPTFLGGVQRRRRSGPDRTETLLTFAHLLANQSANYRWQSCSPEGGPRRQEGYNTPPAQSRGEAGPVPPF